MTRVARRLVLAALFAGAAACRQEKSAPVGAPARVDTLQTVSLPDIARAEPAVQTRLRNQHAEMTRVVADPSSSPDAKAAVYGDMGKLFMATELYDAAERCFSNAHVLAPADVRWPYYLAHVARLGNDPAKAAALFEQVLKLRPDDVPSLVWLAEMRLGQSRPADAKPRLLEAQLLAPREPAVLYGLGRVALETREYADAVKALEGALALAPSAARVHYALAMAYRGMGDVTRADAHLRQRGEAAPTPADPLMGEVRRLLTNSSALETRASQAMDARDWPAAVAALREAIALSPDNAFTRLNLGTSLYLSGDRDGALEQYRAAVRLSPSLARAHFGIGVVLEARHQDRAAIDAFSSAVESDPAYDEARFTLANALRRSGRVAESLSHYETLLERNPGTSQAAFGYAMALVRLGRYREARDRLEHDSRTFAGQPGFAHALARVLAAAPDDGVRDGTRALALVQPLVEQGRSPAILETMAMALAEVGRFDDAVRWQSEAVALARRAGRRELMPHLSENLRLYEARRPCRVPWTDDDPVHHPQPSPD